MKIIVACASQGHLTRYPLFSLKTNSLKSELLSGKINICPYSITIIIYQSIAEQFLKQVSRDLEDPVLVSHIKISTINKLNQKYKNHILD